jgi:hypothetical protein
MKTLINSALAVTMALSTLGAAETIDYSKFTITLDKEQKVEVIDIASVAFNAIPDLSVQPVAWTHSPVEPGMRVPAAAFRIQSATGRVEGHVDLKLTLSSRPGPKISKLDYYTLIRNDYSVMNSDSDRYIADVVIPENLRPGTYYIGLEVDQYDHIDELNEHNNVAYIEIEVGAQHGTFKRSQRVPFAQYESTCKVLYGDNARLAKWEDLEAYAKRGNSIPALIKSLSFPVRDRLAVSYEDQIVDNFQGYHIQRGNPFAITPTSGIIDHIDKHHLDLRQHNNDYYELIEPLCFVPIVQTAVIYQID